MAQSVLEQECIRKRAEWKASIAAHDRGLLLGVFLGLFPLFPIAFFGFLLGAVVLALAVNFLFGLDWYQYPDWLAAMMSRLFHWLQGPLRALRGGVTV